MIIIDRFGGHLAIVEYENDFYNIPLAWLPVEAKEGDAVTITLKIDKNATKKRRAQMKQLVSGLFE